MDINHYNELVELSQEIYDDAADRLTNYCAARYCGVGNDTTEQQCEDYLLVAEETSAYFLGNALALLTPDSQEKEIERVTARIRQVIRFAQEQAGLNNLPN